MTMSQSELPLVASGRKVRRATKSPVCNRKVANHRDTLCLDQVDSSNLPPLPDTLYQFSVSWQTLLILICLITENGNKFFDDVIKRSDLWSRADKKSARRRSRLFGDEVAKRDQRS